MKVIISFDDGGNLDRKAAELCGKYGFTATFYLTSHEAINNKALYLELISKGFEIGGHTVTHPQDIKRLENEQVCYEILQNKADLEKLFNIKVERFCYPRGRHNQYVRDLVKAAGYKEARTTLVLHGYSGIKNTMEIPTTIHMFNRKEYCGCDWLEVAKKYFLLIKDFSKTNSNTFFSLWGHSWELEKNNDWDKFEELLAFMKRELSTI